MFGTVIETRQLSPSMVRVVFGGEGLDSYVPAEATDQYLNLMFLPEESPLTVPFDIEVARAIESDHRPRNRKFTVRFWDPETRQLTVDFVAHGDVGFAGRWAQNASVGDVLQMAGPGGNYQPDPDADWHLLVGDESALPAIAASAEALPAGASAIVVVVVDGPEGEIAIETAAHVDVRWVHRSTASSPDDALLKAVQAIDWVDGDVDVFVHGEAGEVRAVRKFLLSERGVVKEHASISPYWRRDHTDESWRKIKRQWIAEQAADV